MAAAALPLLLITGASGFVGSHVLHQGLEAGYRTRITVRPGKVAAFKNQYKDNENVDVVAIEDLATGDFSNALKDVYAVLHVAAPVPFRADASSMIDGAVNGTVNLLKQAVAAGIRKVVVTSSMVTTFGPNDPKVTSDYTFTDQDWNPATIEDTQDPAHVNSAVFMYFAAKTISEQALWKYAEEHPEVDITTINPPYIYGPLVPGLQVAKGDLQSLSSDALFYTNVLQPNKLLPVQQIEPFNVDVRDVAKAHILALNAAPTSQVGRKRVLLGGIHFSWRDAVEHLSVARPELRGRLPDTSEAEKQTIARIDGTLAANVLGLQVVDWKKTVEDTADSLLEMEKSWYTGPPDPGDSQVG